ncbi:MAG TPA: FG-GAP-like repeat-containing protein [Clostridiales bacterium]|nr:FG-GAP-like repeat-containing protein [Clostridiales bacterium]HQP69997.1 FG-GAP-like repeat-containing protein [Clostridiales bacterium]
MKKFMLIIAIAVSLFGNSGSDAKSSGLVGYWTFDGGNANDLTGNHNGTIVGSGVTFPAGKVGNAVNFSVGTSFIRIPSFNTTNITVEAWVNSTKSGYYTSMVTKNYHPSTWSSPWTAWSLWFNENSANPGTIASQWATSSPDAVSLNQWYHMAFTYDGTTVKVYVNGLLKSSAATAGGPIVQTAGNIHIGKPEFANHSFTGSIDEVAIWDNALPGTEILRHYQNGMNGLGYILAPIVTTDSLTNITPVSAIGGGNVSSDGGSNVTARGVCWNTTGNPTTANFKTEDGTGTGEFASTLTGLTAGTTYYVKAYSVNAIGTSYGEQISFTTQNYFTDIGASLINVSNSHADWGDYDNDGDLDLVMIGYNSNSPYYYSRIYRNDAGVFVDINAGLPGFNSGSADWGDYDNDGDLDLLLTGSNMTKIFKNESGIFSISVSLPNAVTSNASWGDYDNDGDLDIVLTGQISSTSTAVVLRNDGNEVFTNISAGLTGATYGNGDWGDYDNDGDLDLVITGNSSTKIYINDGGNFTDINAGLLSVYYSSVKWADYDNDGDLDLALIGNNLSHTEEARIYKNNGGNSFSYISALTPACRSGSVEWGDYDNDGDLDLLVTGYSGTVGVTTKLYRNDGNDTFSAINSGLANVSHGTAKWGDYDNDGDLDVMLTGVNISKIYRNNCATQNSQPAKPINLALSQNESGLHFSFDPASDTETPSAGLSYNIDINIGDGTVKAASSDFATGKRRISNMGNIQQNTSWNFRGEFPDYAIPNELYEVIWNVQSVDNCYEGSLFASAADTIMNRSLLTVPKAEMIASDMLTWEYYMPADSIASYTLQMSYDSLFTDYYEKSFPVSKDIKTSYFGVDLLSLDIIDSLENNGKYFWRVKPEHINSAIATGFRRVPDSFIYDPVYSAPSPVTITVEGNYITLQWGSGKEDEKGILYNIYSSDDPHAVFPSGWTLLNSVTGTSYLINSSVKKKFYCVTAEGTGK